MARFTVGGAVVAVKDIHKVWTGEFVPKGSVGVVVDPGGLFSGPMKVRFTIRRLFLGDTQLTITVESRQVA